MCGRYTLAANADELVEAFDVPVPTFALAPRYNIAPGQQAPVVAEDRHGRRLGLLTWGLVPDWKEDPVAPMINARMETVAARPSFREAIDRRRCLVPADGFYEWKREGERKVPHWIHPSGGGLLSLAAIWETWRRPGTEPRHAFAILTTAANADVAPIHDRMPVIVAAEGRDAWLDRAVDGAEALRRLRPTRAGALASRPVSTRVNRVASDDAGLIERVG
jgi:putative SOS response-associated peptidase YedK